MGKLNTGGAQKARKQAATSAPAQGAPHKDGVWRALWWPSLVAALVLVGAILVGLTVSRQGQAQAPPLEAAGNSTATTTATRGSSSAWDTPSPSSADTLTLAAQRAGIDMSAALADLPGAEPEVRVVSQSPRIFLLENVLSRAECEFLIGLVDGRLKPAGVVLQTNDKHTVQTQARNNEQIWITPEEERTIPILQHILKRLHRVAHIPDTDAEALQIGRYAVGQKYESHLDTDPGHDVERPATLLLYLSDVEAGGDTLFPLGEREKCASKWYKKPDGTQVYGCATCCEGDVLPGTIRVRPKQGHGVLFFNHKLNGEVDRLSEHAACPVRAGTKWIAQRWFRLDPYQNVKFPFDQRFDGLPMHRITSPWGGQTREMHRKNPRLYLLENLLSAEECEALKQLAVSSGLSSSTPGSEPASESGSGPGPGPGPGLELWRLGEEAERQGRPLLDLLKRLHRAARVPDLHGEVLEVARMAENAEVPLQHDAADANANANGGSSSRVALLLVFLSDPEKGGEALFPRGRCRGGLEACCKQRKLLRVPAQKGRGLLLYLRMTGNRQRDKTADYGICSVQRGEAWVARLWFHASPVRSKGFPSDPAYDLPLPLSPGAGPTG